MVNYYFHCQHHLLVIESINLIKYLLVILVNHCIIIYSILSDHLLKNDYLFKIIHPILPAVQG